MSFEGATRRESRASDALYGPNGSRRGSTAEVRRSEANKARLAEINAKREMVREGSFEVTAAKATVVAIGKVRKSSSINEFVDNIVLDDVRDNKQESVALEDVRDNKQEEVEVKARRSVSTKFDNLSTFNSSSAEEAGKSSDLGAKSTSPMKGARASLSSRSSGVPQKLGREATTEEMSDESFEKLNASTER